MSPALPIECRFKAQGLSLVELIMATFFFGVLTTAIALSMNPYLLAWSSQQDRLELQHQLRHGLDVGLVSLRSAAKTLGDPADAIRFTRWELTPLPGLGSIGTETGYILYLYHPSDVWPPTYTQPAYQLRLARLTAGMTGAINGTFSYGSGTLLMRDLKPPPATDLSVLGKVAILDLTGLRGDEQFRLIEKVKRRGP